MSATIGVPRRRVDGGDKVRGATRYAADVPIPGVLHARLVLATEAHPRLVSIHGEAAGAAPSPGGGPPPAPPGRRAPRPPPPAAPPRRPRRGGGAARARGGRLRRP